MNPIVTRLHTIFRVSTAMCFIGHGVFGIITKPIWCNYFSVFGIGQETAYGLMPLVGTADILFGFSLFFYPTRAVAGWLVIWGLFTALLRPVSGEPLAEFAERAGNYGMPVVWLLMNSTVGLSFKDWFRKMDPQTMSEEQLNRVVSALRICAFTLLAGHGWLNLLQKPALLDQYSRLGFDQANLVATAIGWFEVAGAVMILVKPIRQFILLLVIWKIFSEFFHSAYAPIEWIERGGSYGALLALWVMTTAIPVRKKLLVQGSS